MKGLIVVLVLFFVVWDIGWMFAGVRPLFPWQLKTMLREHPENLVLVDVRTPVEYGLFHIPGAKLVPEVLEGGELPPEVREPRPGSTVVMICMSGHRSPIAAKQLQTRIKAPVVNLTWGMLGWLASFGPVRGGER